MKSLLIVLATIIIPLLSPAQRLSRELGHNQSAMKKISFEAFKQAHDKYNLRWIEIWSGALDGATEQKSQKWVDELRSAIKGSGLKIWSVHLPFSRNTPNDISDDRPQWREKSLENWISNLDYCSKVGKFKVVVVHPSSEAKISDTDRPKRLNNLKEMLIRFIPMVKERYGATVAVENLPRGCLGNSLADFQWLLTNVPDLKICYDSNHLLGERSALFASTFVHDIVTVHISDYDGKDERHWMPGKGIVEWPKVIDALVSGGYKGPFMYELNSKNDPRAVIENIKPTTDSLFHAYKNYKAELKK